MIICASRDLQLHWAPARPLHQRLPNERTNCVGGAAAARDTRLPIEAGGGKRGRVQPPCSAAGWHIACCIRQHEGRMSLLSSMSGYSSWSELVANSPLRAAADEMICPQELVRARHPGGAGYGGDARVLCGQGRRAGGKAVRWYDGVAGAGRREGRGRAAAAGWRHRGRVSVRVPAVCAA